MEEIKFPVYAKIVIILLGILLAGIFFFLGQHILMPFLFALMFAILLNPVMEFLIRKKVPRLVSIVLTVFAGVILLSGLFYFLYIEIAQFGDALPTLKQKASENLVNLQNWLSSSYHISAKKQIEWLNKMLVEAQAMIGPTISKFMDILLSLTLIPIYVFLLLFYKPLLIAFLVRVFSKKSHASVLEIMGETKIVIQSYIIGLMIEAAIIAVLNCAGLLILGIDYAILLGVLGALLNVIPYIGGIIAILLPIIISLTTKDSISYTFGIIILYAVIQFIDNHYISPKIVASKVRINMLFSILGVLAGGELAGVGGMFLSLPCIAILKIIFDRVEALKPWGLLLGDNMELSNNDGTLNQKLKPKKA